MYYVMQPDAQCDSEFIWFQEGPDDDGEQWCTGQPFAKVPDIVRMSSDNEKRLPFSDVALNDFALHVHSPKFRKVLHGLGVTNIEYLPALLVDKAKGVQRDDYGVANFLGKIECLDFKHANVTAGRRIPIASVQEFALLEERIAPLPGMTIPPLIFRLAEYDALVIAHESVKAACEENAITAISFTPTVDYY